MFDLLTALLDSWSVWNAAAGNSADGLRWRREYLILTYACGTYRPYEDVVFDAARAAGISTTAVDALLDTWDTLSPWPEASAVLRQLVGRGVLLGVVTNCSIALGRRAAERVGVPFTTIVTAEEACFYKPRAEPYRIGLERLGTLPERTLFVAGSPADIPGAAGVGMPVFWHNRAGLPLLDDSVRPMLVTDTLRTLSELVP